MVELFFENTTSKKRYKVLAFDKEAGTVTLQGLAEPWVEPFDRARFERMGYTLVKDEAKPADDE